ncbi:MAG: hypothetical protein GF331_03760, partial [Chitinivibrionales bacterium]|nr:hypothetical protein [Chitinivibrionales bacterium]
MAANIEVRLDEEHQIIVQRVVGEMTMEDFERLEAMTHECVQRLRDRTRVLMLIDGGRLDPT